MRVLLAVAFLGVGLAAQDAPPRLTLAGGIDGGVGGLLVFPDGSSREFHIEARAVRAVLCASRMPDQGRPIAVGSDDEKALLVALEAWISATFEPEEQQALLAQEKLSPPRNDEETRAHWRAEVLRAVRYYGEVTQPEVTNVFAGRGTVSLSLQLRLGPGATRQLLWRRMGDDAFARMHLDTEVEPIPIGSRLEGQLLLALGNWLRARFGGEDALWQSEPADLPADVRLVLGAYRGYLEATSPRLAGVGVIMDNGIVGTRLVEVWDAQRRLLHVRFDNAANSPAPGRLLDGQGQDAPLVELGSAREAELLRLLDRAALLRRRALGEGAEQDHSLRMLDEELDKYRRRFHEQRADK